MKKIDCIAVDDEPIALEKIESFIRKVPFLNLQGLFSNPMEAFDYINTNHVGLIFLDIQMEDLTGIQMLEIMPSRPKVILTTAYDRYAIKGYELDVTDYLLKPFSFERFLHAVTKVLEHTNEAAEIKEQEPTNNHTHNSEADFIFVKTEFRMQKVNLKDILYIEGMKDYLKFVVTTGRCIMTLLSFKRVEEMLPADRFCRVHKSYIVSVDKIESVERGLIQIADKRIPIGDNYKKCFQNILESKSLI